jgi:hypothetical protein
MLFMLISLLLSAIILVLTAAATVAAETLRLYAKYHVTLRTAFITACKGV